MKTFRTIITTAALLACTPALAGDAGAGETAFNSKGCVGCHGTNGATPAPGNPKLAGKSAAEVKKSLTDYKSGARKNATMNAMAGMLSDADIDNIATYLGGK